jgi:DNA topoisomerase IB
MHTATRAVAVSVEDDAPRERRAFLDEQLAHARVAAALSATALVLACRGGTPAEMDSAASSATEATAELRIALRAHRLSSA